MIKPGDKDPSRIVASYYLGDTGKHGSPFLGLRVLTGKKRGNMNNFHFVGLHEDYVGCGIGEGFVNHAGLSRIGINVRLALASTNRTALSNIV